MEQTPKFTPFFRYEGCTMAVRFKELPELFADKLFELLKIIANFLFPANGKRTDFNISNKRLQDDWFTRVARQLYILIKNYLDVVDNRPINNDYT